MTADFNNDTVLDLAVGNHNNEGRVSVLLGNGDGSFQPALHSLTGAVPLSLAAGDFDADGNLDLATANAYDVTVLLGNGDGSFQPTSSIGFSDSEHPQAVAVGDFNGDGLLDLGVTSNAYYGYYYYNNYHGYANVLLGHGDGSFSGPNRTPLGWGEHNAHNAALAADLNGDDFDDFVTLNGPAKAVKVLFGHSSGYLQGHSGTFWTASYPQSVAAGDLDADGDIDLVTGNSVLLGNGAGGFSYAGNDGASGTGMVLGDFTGDGMVDLAATNSSVRLNVLPGEGDGTFAPT